MMDLISYKHFCLHGIMDKLCSVQHFLRKNFKLNNLRNVCITADKVYIHEHHWQKLKFLIFHSFKFCATVGKYK